MWRTTVWLTFLVNYETSLQGKSADDLLLESLNNIKKSLLPVINLIEEKKLEKLSISTRKLAI